MMNFIPMTKTVTIYKQVGGTDDWGQPTRKKLGTFKCQTDFSTNLDSIQHTDGHQKVLGGTLVIHGKVDITVGDLAEFAVVNIPKSQYMIHSVSFLVDLSGKIIGTKVVVGNGKRS